MHRTIQNSNEVWSVYFLNIIRTANGILDLLFENETFTSRMEVSGNNC